MSTQKNASIGRIVHYILSEEDATQINRRRTTGALIASRIKEEKWPLGAQAHIGNDASAGQVFPAIVVNDNGINSVHVNLQVFLDGNDVFWATSRHEDNTDEQQTPGTWHWPLRQ